MEEAWTQPHPTGTHSPRGDKARGAKRGRLRPNGTSDRSGRGTVACWRIREVSEEGHLGGDSRDVMSPGGEVGRRTFWPEGTDRWLNGK